MSYVICLGAEACALLFSALVKGMYTAEACSIFSSDRSAYDAQREAATYLLEQCSETPAFFLVFLQFLMNEKLTGELYAYAQATWSETIPYEKGGE